MPSNAYNKFIASMQIDYNKWHDGEGYDLDALRQLTDAEKKSVRKLLQGRTDWRDVEAIAVLNEEAESKGEADALELLEALEAFTEAKNGEARIAALEKLYTAKKLTKDQLEERLLDELKRVSIGDGLTQCFFLLDEVPTQRIKGRMLWCMYNRQEISVNVAGKLWQLCGKSDEDFDWNMRPLFLKFGKGVSSWEQYKAGQEFCQLVGMKTEDAQ